MRNIIRKTLFCAVLSGTVILVAASPPIVGVAQSAGEIRLNNAAVPGGATLFDGARLQTTSSTSNVALANGGRLLLASASTVTFHPDRAVLQNGTAELSSAASYQIQAGGLRIAPTTTAARVRVDRDSSARINVSATGGEAEVRSARGVLVARVFPGAALQIREVADQTTKLTGKVTVEDGHYLLTDDTTSVTVELRGSNLQSLVGKQVQVVGSVVQGQAAAGASQIVQVAEIAASKAGVAGAAAAGATAHISGTATAVIVGAAATGATVGGLAAAGTIGGSESSVSR